MKSIFTCLLLGFSSIALAQQAASLRFSADTARTGEESFYDHFLVSKETPLSGSFCIEDIRSIRKINKTLSSRISKLSFGEARQFDLKNYNWTTYRETRYITYIVIPSLYASTPFLPQYHERAFSCDVMATAKDEMSGKSFLLHDYVSTESVFPFVHRKKIKFNTVSDFTFMIDAFSLLYSDVMKEVAPKVADSLVKTLKKRDRKARSEEQKKTLYTQLQRELAEIMCLLKAVKLAEKSCIPSSIDQRKYVDEIIYRYDRLLNPRR